MPVTVSGSSPRDGHEHERSHPYSPATVASGLIFVSGALSIDPAGQAVPGRATAIQAAMDRLVERLAVVGADRRDIVKLTYFVTDLSLRQEANDQFIALFPAPRPARTFVEVSGLPYGAAVEIDAVARISTPAEDRDG
jgi:enamine deaminase RidA (YjgF/YER057c/UK114 family)